MLQAVQAAARTPPRLVKTSRHGTCVRAACIGAVRACSLFTNVTNYGFHTLVVPLPAWRSARDDRATITVLTFDVIF